MAKLDQGAVADYFGKRLGAPVTIHRMRPTFPGISRETFLVEAEVAGEPQSFALRLDHPWGGSCPHSLHQEWEIYRRLWQSPVPVAEPLWFDAGIDFAEGRPHMVRRLVDGSTTVPGVTAATAEGAKLRQRIALECAEKLALVHTLDWRSLGFDAFLTPPPSPAAALRTELSYWRGLWDAGRQGPFPVIEEALCWLDETMPADTPFVSLVKGNNGIGEEIWRGEKIIAMSDWELACLNDGVLDLAFSQGTLTLGDMGETLRHYGKCVGCEVSPYRLAAGMFVTWFKQIVCEVVYMYNRYIDGRDKRLPMLTFGMIFPKTTQHRLAACIGKDLVDAWSGVSNQEQSAYFRVSKAAT